MLSVIAEEVEPDSDNDRKDIKISLSIQVSV